MRLGVYLSPEPLLQDPDDIAVMLGGGVSVWNYAYANNNPIGRLDPDGRVVWNVDALDEKIRADRLKFFKEAAKLLDGFLEGPYGQNCIAFFKTKWGADLRSLLVDGSGPTFNVKSLGAYGALNTGTSCDFNERNAQLRIDCSRYKIIHELAHILQEFKRPGSATPDAFKTTGEGFEAEMACFGPAVDGKHRSSTCDFSRLKR